MASKSIAACIGLGGFCIAVVMGMLSNNPLDVVIIRAVIAMFACFFVGWMIGYVSTKVINTAIVQKDRETKLAAREARRALEPLEVSAVDEA
jgi:hypothetical protein